MRNPFKCRFFRDHDYEMRREPGAVYLECRHCGRRSTGWSFDERRVKRIDSRQRIFMADSLDAVRELPAEDGADVVPSAALAQMGELRLTFGRRNWS